MNQVKIGEFLRELRKGKGLTQEQLAEQFNISRRSVSRWETGSNMPDVGLLIEIADFFEVDIREIIDGERKSENMDNETRDTLKKVAEYAAEEKKRIQNKLVNLVAACAIVMICCATLFAKETKGLLNGIVPEQICAAIMATVIGIAAIMIVVYYLFIFGAFDSFIGKKKQ